MIMTPRLRKAPAITAGCILCIYSLLLAVAIFVFTRSIGRNPDAENVEALKESVRGNGIRLISLLLMCFALLRQKKDLAAGICFALSTAGVIDALCRGNSNWQLCVLLLLLLSAAACVFSSKILFEKLCWLCPLLGLASAVLSVQASVSGVPADTPGYNAMLAAALIANIPYGLGLLFTGLAFLPKCKKKLFA